MGYLSYDSIESLFTAYSNTFTPKTFNNNLFHLISILSTYNIDSSLIWVRFWGRRKYPFKWNGRLCFCGSGRIQKYLPSLIFVFRLNATLTRGLKSLTRLPLSMRRFFISWSIPTLDKINHLFIYSSYKSPILLDDLYFFILNDNLLLFEWYSIERIWLVGVDFEDSIYHWIIFGVLHRIGTLIIQNWCWQIMERER
jgi:hypothetical protein